jgi:excisionase family DNA binding protein
MNRRTPTEAVEWLTATPAEAARYLGVTRQWVYQLMARRELRSVKVHGTTRSRFTGKLMPRLLRREVDRVKRRRDAATGPDRRRP